MEDERFETVTQLPLSVLFDVNVSAVKSVINDATLSDRNIDLSGASPASVITAVLLLFSMLSRDADWSVFTAASYQRAR